VSAARVRGLLQGTAGLTEPVAHLVTALGTTTAPASVWRALPLPGGVAGAGSGSGCSGRSSTPGPRCPGRERDALHALLHNCAPRGWAGQTRGHDPAAFRDHVLGRVAWAGSLDPVLGERLHAAAARIDWS
jgi:RNA-directed DNA polymerase